MLPEFGLSLGDDWDSGIVEIVLRPAHLVGSAEVRKQASSNTAVFLADFEQICVHEAACPTISPSNNHTSINKSIMQSIIQSIMRSIMRSINRMINLSVNSCTRPT